MSEESTGLLDFIETIRANPDNRELNQAAFDKVYAGTVDFIRKWDKPRTVPQRAGDAIFLVLFGANIAIAVMQAVSYVNGGGAGRLIGFYTNDIVSAFMAVAYLAMIRPAERARRASIQLWRDDLAKFRDFMRENGYRVPDGEI